MLLHLLIPRDHFIYGNGARLIEAFGIRQAQISNHADRAKPRAHLQNHGHKIAAATFAGNMN